MWKIVNGLGINDTSVDKQLPFDADTFNAHFVTTTNLGMLHDTRPSVRISADNQFYFKHVTIVDATEAINSAHSNALGPDDIPLRHLKDCLPVILRSLINIFDLSLQSGIFPTKWKQAYKYLTTIH